MASERYLATHYEIIRVPPPVAGAEILYRAGGRYADRIVHVHFRFTASVAVANRLSHLAASDGQTVFWRVPTNQIVAAAGVERYSGFPGSPQSAAIGSEVNFPLPIEGLLLLPGWRLFTTTDAIDVADQYDEVAIVVQRFRTGPNLEQLPTLDIQATPRE